MKTVSNIVPTLVAVAAIALSAGAARGQTVPMRSADRHELGERLKGPVIDNSAILKSVRAVPRTAGQCKTDWNYAGSIEKNFVPALEYPTSSGVQVDLEIQFEINSFEIRPESHALLDELALALRDPQLGSARFVVAGHTDRTGPHDFNENLSCARAISVRQYLINRGVEANRLGLYGFGSRMLLGDFGPEDPRHRRVEIRRAPDRAL